MFLKIAAQKLEAGDFLHVFLRFFFFGGGGGGGGGGRGVESHFLINIFLIKKECIFSIGRFANKDLEHSFN